jgi:alkylated DNA nucleotide flippase Atl1
MTEESKFERGYGLALLRYHRARERAHAEFARDLAVLVGEDMVDVPQLKGAIQRRIAGLPQLATADGMTAGEVARQLAYDEANTYTALNSLEKAGLVEVVSGATPRRWRLTVKHRRDRILRLSRLVPKGRWTTYGEFSIAVYDNWRMAITVGRVASKNPAFANPHRVLRSGGVIPPDWADDEGRGPEECERRLREEGVSFNDNGQADPNRFIGWEELKRLLEQHESEEDLEDAA